MALTGRIRKSLEGQRDFLEGNGYSRAALVADALAGNVDPLETGKRHPADSDVNFLIFARAGTVKA